MIGDREAEDAAIRALRDGWAGLSASARAEADAAVAEIEARRAAHPLAYARLWDAPAPRTSQRRAVQAILQPGVRSALILGGNRSGKSAARAQLVVALALGRSHPDVIAWGRWNGLDLAALPDGPGEVWSVALDSGDSRGYVRPADAALMPSGTRWRNRDGLGEAEAVLPGGARIRYKTVDQGRDGFQGAKPRAIVFDEEPRDLGVIHEAGMRLVDSGGLLLAAMTPLYGWTPFLVEYAKEPRADTVIQWLHGADNPHIPAEELMSRLSRYGSHERAARERGEITALEGRVYQDFRRDLHVIPAFRPPADWTRYESIDWGTSVPTCVLLFAYDASSDTVHVLSQTYAAQMTIPQRAERIRAQEAEGGVPDMRWADPEDASTNLTIIRDYDLQVWPALKAIKFGINAVAARLAPDVEGRPHLLIHDCCSDVIREIEGYVWGPNEMPLKKNDHAMDALRYGVVGISGVYGLLPGPAEDLQAA